jgi:voltage-gated potassium channel
MPGKLHPAAAPPAAPPSWRERLRHLYYGETTTAAAFRIALLILDLLIVGYFVVSSFLHPSGVVTAVDIVLAAALALELAARGASANHIGHFLLRFGTIIDLLIIASLLAPLLTSNLAFLRIVRMLRLLRSYHVLRQLRAISPWFRRNEEIVQSTANLAIFVFFITAVVFVLQAPVNPQISNYVDALYFTVTTLTTTGFGDITLQGTSGRLLAVAIMVFGVALFLRLIQTIFRPNRIANRCPECGLLRHDFDAAHCKRCGAILKYRPGLDEM